MRAELRKTFTIPNTVRALAICAAAGLAACNSAVPVAQTYSMSSQQKMQSAHHWDVLAKHVAEDMAVWLPSSAAAGRPLVIRAGGVNGAGNAFARGFEGFLTTRLHDLGFAMAVDGYDGYRIEYETQVINHKGHAFNLKPGTFTLLGSGIAVATLAQDGLNAGVAAGGAVAAGIAADVASGYVTSETNTEVIISITAVDQGLVAFRRNFIFYINDADAQQYGDDGNDILVLVDARKPNAVQDAWRSADLRCGERGRGKAILRVNKVTEERRELRFECVDHF